MNLELHLIENGRDRGALPSVRGLQISPVFEDYGSITFEYPIKGKRYSLLAGKDEFEVVPYINGISYPRLGGFVQETSGDDVAEAAVKTYGGIGYLRLMDEAIVYPKNWPNQDAENPSWVFTAATAGTIMGTLAALAKGRGALAGVTWGFTGLLDSAGQPWAKAVNLEVKPQTPLTSVLRSMSGLQMVEFRMNGYVLEMFNPGTFGVDRTVQARPLTFRRGRDLVDSPRKISTRDLATVMLGAGKEDIGIYSEKINVSAVASRRRIEGAVSNGNISDPGTLAAFTELRLAQSVNPRMEKTHGLVFGETKNPRPLRDFDTGDWAYSDVGKGNERYRIRQWVLSQDDNGLVTGSVTLNDLFAEIEEKLARRIDGIVGGTTITGESKAVNRIPDNLIDGLPPGKAAGLGATSEAYVEAGQTYAQVTATWAQVTQNADGTLLEDLEGYQVRWSANSAEAPDPVTVSTLTEAKYQQLVAQGWTGRETTPVPPARTQAAAEVLQRLISNMEVFEDFSFRGMSANYASFQEGLATDFYAANPGTNWPTPGVERARTWLAAYIVTNTTRPTLLYHPLYRQTAWRYIPPVAGTTVSWSPMQVGIPIYLQVRAIDKAGNVGEWSNQTGILTGVDAIPPEAPSAPVVDNYLGLLRSYWNGRSVYSTAMATDTASVEVHVSTTNNFTPSVATRVDSLRVEGYSFFNAPYGVTHYVRLVAVDRSGNRSVPSPVGSASTGQVVSSDVFDGAIGSAKLADLAVITAKIADLAVNNAKIGSMEVGKITAGVLNATIVLGNRITTALTGQRTEMNQLGFYGWDADGNQTLGLDGINNLMTGTLTTASGSGRRVIVGNQTETTGRIAFVAADGRYGRIRGFTEGTGLEAMRIEMYSTGSTFGSYINFNTDHYTSYRGTKHEFTARDWWRVLVNGGGDTWAATTQRLYIDTVAFRTQPGSTTLEYNQQGSNASYSGLLKLFTTGGGAVALRANSESSQQNMDVVNQDGTVWYSVRASQFLLQSDGEAKSEPTPVRTADALASVLAMPVRRYRRRNAGDYGYDLQDREEVGFITQELPDDVVIEGAGTQFVNLYEVVARLAGSVQALNRKINELEAAS